MQPLYKQYVGKYESTLVKFKAAQGRAGQDSQGSELIDELVEIRKILNELMAIACRSLSDRDCRLFKYSCEEIEERFLVQ